MQSCARCSALSLPAVSSHCDGVNSLACLIPAGGWRGRDGHGHAAGLLQRLHGLLDALPLLPLGPLLLVPGAEQRYLIIRVGAVPVTTFVTRQRT